MKGHNKQEIRAVTDNTPNGKIRIYRGKPVRRMHVMVKPTGALCNLDCTYCYYLSKQQLKDKSGQGSFDRVLRAAKLLRKYKVNFATLTGVNRVTAKHPLGETFEKSGFFPQLHSLPVLIST